MRLPKLVKRQESDVKHPVVPGRDARFDALFASIRSLTARTIALETQVSTLRRDVNATRMRVYREEAVSSKVESEIIDPFKECDNVIQQNAATPNH